MKIQREMRVLLCRTVVFPIVFCGMPFLYALEWLFEGNMARPGAFLRHVWNGD